MYCIHNVVIACNWVLGSYIYILTPSRCSNNNYSIWIIGSNNRNNLFCFMSRRIMTVSISRCLQVETGSLLHV